MQSPESESRVARGDRVPREINEADRRFLQTKVFVYDNKDEEREEEKEKNSTVLGDMVTL